MIRKPVALSLLLIACFILSSCGSIPKLTAGETEMVSEYAASLLLKYDADNHTRLVDTSDYLAQYYAAKKAHDDAEAAYYRAIAEEEEKRRQEAIAQANANNEYNNSLNENGKKKDDGTAGAAVVNSAFNNMTIGEFLGYPGFSIQYAGTDILDSYPEDSTDIALPASPGSDLLVIYFNVTNSGSSSELLDVFSLNFNFRLSVNGAGASGVLYPTMLYDVLSEFDGSINAGETKRLVLIKEVKEGTSVDTLSLSIVSPAGTMTKVLK